MKVGDLVKVHPACAGYYIVVAQMGGYFSGGYQMWRICGSYEYGDNMTIDMSEKWMEIVSSSPHLEKS